MSDEPSPTADRLAALEELVASLRPVILADHTEHGLQGMSGLVGQYRAALSEIEQIKAKQPAKEATPLARVADLAAKRAAKSPTRAARGRV